MALALLALLATPTRAEGPASSEAKRDAIRQLLETTGSVDLGRQVASGITAQLAPLFPDVPPELWNEVLAGFDTDEVVELIVPIYDRHFELAEIQGLIEFYDTPLGRTLLEKLPAITQESMAAGQAWGQRKAMEVIERLGDRGYTPTQL